MYYVLEPRYGEYVPVVPEWNPDGTVKAVSFKGGTLRKSYQLENKLALKVASYLMAIGRQNIVLKKA